MNPDAAVRELLRLARHAARWTGSVLETLWLGMRLLMRVLWGILRLPRHFAGTRRCPRGHTNDLYGVWRCRCDAVVEGHAFRTNCRVCGQSTGWIPCERCGLPIVR
jgi:hypothetical protein